MPKKIVRLIKLYSSAIEIPLGMISSILLSNSIVLWLKNGNIDYRLLFFGLVSLTAQVFLAVYPRYSLKKEKRTIINNLLHSCKKLLFMNCCENDWSVCGMIQVPDKKKNIRRTPYYINPSVNSAIRNHRNLRFGDVGKAFFGDGERKTCFAKLLSKESWEQSDADYKNEVPKDLKAIIAFAIFSSDEIDSKDIIGVLEFDIFNKKNENDIPEELFKSISCTSNMDAICEWTSSIAILMQEI